MWPVLLLLLGINLYCLCDLIRSPVSVHGKNIIAESDFFFNSIKFIIGAARESEYGLFIR